MPDTPNAPSKPFTEMPKSQTQLISDLLDVSRIISNKLMLTISSVSLPSIIETALDAVSPEAEAKSIGFNPQSNQASHRFQAMLSVCSRSFGIC